MKKNRLNEFIFKNINCDFIAIPKNDLLYKSYNKKNYFLFSCWNVVKSLGINQKTIDYWKIAIIA